MPYRLPDVIRAGTDQLIFIVEGEKDADKLAKHGYVATTNPFGAGKWREQYNEYFVGRHIVIVPDNDEPGRNHAEHVRAQLESAAASVRVLSLENEVAEKGDISDLIDAQGIDSFKRLLESLPPAHSKPKPYLTLSDLHRLPRREWLVDGLIPQKAVALLYGDSGVGKSFIALDLCVRIATGQTAHGRDTKQGLAIYVALEGHAGLYDRLRAAAVHAGQQSMSGPKVAVVNGPLDLCGGDSVTGLLAAIRTAASDFAVRPALVVIDTLSRAMPGANENSPDDMNRVTGALIRIQEETGATVLTIHHSGKTKDRGARGHSSLRAAMDTELLVDKNKSGKYLKVTKQRDGEDGIRLGFELTPAQVPASGHQGTVETRVVTPGGQSSDDARAPLSRQAGGFRKALEAALSASSRRASEEEAEQLGVPAGTAVATKDEWLEQARGMQLSTSDQSLSRALNRARTALSDADLLRQAGDLYWLPQPSGILGRPGRGPGQARTGQA